MIAPVYEAVLDHHGRRYVGHCVRDDDCPPGVFVVCLYRCIALRGQTLLEYMGHGVYGPRRFVSDVNGKAGGKQFRQRVWEAIQKEVAG